MLTLKLMLTTLTQHNLDAYIFKISDHHLSEYISPCDQFLQYATGFTGSNGLAILTKTQNVLFTDGRYFIQAKKELKNNFELKKYGEDESVAEFLKNLGSDKKIGLDKRYFDYNKFKELKEELSAVNTDLIHLEVESFKFEMPKKQFKAILDLESKKLEDFYVTNEQNNSIFKNNPLVNKILTESNLTGSERAIKIKKIQEKLVDESYIITELDTIAWLFNLRGTDIEFNPVFYSYSIITKNTATLFVGQELKLPFLDVKKYEEFYEALENIDKAIISNSCNAFIGEKIKEISFDFELSERKSIKNSVELEGMRLAHLLDGVALSVLFGWLETEIYNSITEEEVSKHLKSIKQEIGGFFSESFETIVGSGINSAIIHHKADDTLVDPSNILLIDSGSQFYFGTTDVTRTLHFGVPTPKQKQDYTKVLKSFLTAKKLTYKEITLTTLDSIARVPLWKYFQDYEHGTSHGVGHFLNVHEHPPTYKDKLNENQIISIEPGLYFEDEYGIRIEDLVVVKKVTEKFYQFEGLTCVPFHLKLIDVELLEKDEVDLVNEYSKWVRKELLGLVSDTAGEKYVLENTKKLISK